MALSHYEWRLHSNPEITERILKGMDFQSVMETMAEAWVAANTKNEVQVNRNVHQGFLFLKEF